MTGKTHKMIGITASMGYFLVYHTISYQPATFVAVLVAAYFGALLPDADNAKADIWHSLPLGDTAGRVADPFIKHRNLSHSLLGITIVGLLLNLLIDSFPAYWGIDKMPVLLSFLIAYGFHLVADMFTVEGIPVFYPWQRNFGIPPRPFHGMRIVSGKWFENLVVFPLINIVLIAVIALNWGSIKLLIFK